ncbi:hypothetical protein [Sphingobium sp. CR28]|uniref:hypothetical protein n=1 Tax=Sphingobium sp. CR28 TaxID=3400272 RepID=UPI003FF0874A
MEASDAARIEAAIDEMRQAIDQVKEIGAVRADPAIRKQLETLLPQLDSSRMLACLLGDLAGQKLATLSSANGDIPHPLYSRSA